MEVKETDRVSRIVCKKNRKNYLRPGSLTVKPKAFMPNRYGETSVFITTKLDENQVWGLGESYVCNDSDPVMGRADISASEILEQRLRIHFNNEPEHHANITGWPDLETEKDKSLDIAIVLSAKATCIIRS